MVAAVPRTVKNGAISESDDVPPGRTPPAEAVAFALLTAFVGLAVAVSGSTIVETVSEVAQMVASEVASTVSSATLIASGPETVTAPEVDPFASEVVEASGAANT